MREGYMGGEKTELLQDSGLVPADVLVAVEREKGRARSAELGAEWGFVELRALLTKGGLLGSRRRRSWVRTALSQLEGCQECCGTSCREFELKGGESQFERTANPRAGCA